MRVLSVDATARVKDQVSGSDRHTALLQGLNVLPGKALNMSHLHVVGLTLDCAGAPGAGDLNCLRSTCSPSLMTRYFDSSG